MKCGRLFTTCLAGVFFLCWVVLTEGGGAVAAADGVDGNAVAVASADATGAVNSPIPRTGQTVTYRPRDDGRLRKGTPWPVPRFVEPGDGTVRDALTGLVWLKNADCAVFYSGDKTNANERRWNHALIAANRLESGACGLTDGSVAGEWRLPNVRELESLIDYAFHYPAISDNAGTGHWSEGDPFDGVQSSFYWSSTTVAGDPDYAWVQDLYYGYVYYHFKTFSAHVWPVRDGR